MQVNGLRKLRIYQVALEGVRTIYTVTRENSLSRDFSLADQIRRAAMSVVANIAEGYGRGTTKDFANFISIAMGSSNEVIAFLDIIERLYPKIPTNGVREYYESLGRQLNAFRRSLRDQIKQKANSQKPIANS